MKMNLKVGLGFDTNVMIRFDSDLQACNLIFIILGVSYYYNIED